MATIQKQKGRDKMKVQDRSKYIGGHCIANLVGVGYDTIWHTYLMKTDKEYQAKQEEKSKDIVLFDCGKALEPVIQKKCLELLPDFTFKKGKFIRDRKQSYMGGTPDGFFVHTSKEKYIAEFKTTNDQGDWGEEATDQIPAKVAIQCQWYMMLSGATKAIVGVIFWNSKFKMYVIDRDSEVINNLRLIAMDFWFDHVQKRIEPQNDYSDACRKFLIKSFIGRVTKEIEPSAEVRTWGIHAAGFAKQKQDAEKQYKKIINDLIASMSDATKIKCAEWSLSVSDKGRVTFRAKGVDE